MKEPARTFEGLLGAAAPPLARHHDPAPHGRVLSNGRYWTLITGAGTGLSQCGPIAVTRWSSDRVADAEGVAIYLRDMDTGELWSLGFQPIADAPGASTAKAGIGSVTLGRRVFGIDAQCRIAVAGGADAELRLISVRNRSQRMRRIEVTAYAEIVNGWRGADQGHPAFSKLFVQTEYEGTSETLLARRRPRGGNETPSWVAGALYGAGNLDFDTDRARFLGRGASLQSPAMIAEGSLSRTMGSVLDPVFAMRRRMTIRPEQEMSLALVLAAGYERAGVLAAVSQLRTPQAQQALLDEADKAERERRKRNHLTPAQAESAQAIGVAMLYQHPALRAGFEDLMHASGDESPLAALGIAPDSLLVVMPARHGDLMGRVRDVSAVVRYLRDLGLSVTLAVLCEDAACTSEACRLSAVLANAAIVRRVADLGADASRALRAAAHWIADTAARELAGQSTEPAPGKARLARVRSGAARSDAGAGAAREAGARGDAASAEAEASRSKLIFDNGHGGFSADGSEYVVRVGEGAGFALPPAPWVNIVANDEVGFVASESGAGYTWASNSRQNKLTPWSNDPILDPHGQALYLRDHDSDRYWSPQPGPAASGMPCEVRHGFGYTIWRQRGESIDQETCAFVAGAEPVRLVRVRLKNRGTKPRRLSLYSIDRLVLGVSSAEHARTVVTEQGQDGALLARNALSEDHSSAIAFGAVLVSPGAVSWTTDGAEFVGRGRTMAAPQAVVSSTPLQSRAGSGLDPCFAFEVSIELAARAEAEVVFALGQAGSREKAHEVLSRLRGAEAVDAALDHARRSWRDTLSAVRVETPSKPLDLLLNGWLLYQTLSCRMRARSAFYQCGGAFGFRDQLQDSAALVHARPDLSRAQLLLHAEHQFAEGDVLHWWHPPADRGTRTRFSDDLLWLPYLTAHYVAVTGDQHLLDSSASFLGARALAEGEDEAYVDADRSDTAATVYEHCLRSIDRSLGVGEHGLPLMGTGDWNDGMNRVGREGRGESVWLGFFLCTILEAFAPICRARGDEERAGRYESHRARLVSALNDAGWDGKWYRRAFYDDGSPLGSAADEECRIDVLAQAWAVLSKVAPPERAEAAMAAADEMLVDRKARIVRLLAPPFDKTERDPGYIKGYVPGIRENGGQYTHGALWLVRALAEMGRREQALELFEMISPVVHAADAAAVDIYKVEPYVVAADIYGVAPHLGRGGWTWYTGSAGWMYRVGLESLLGLTLEGGSTLVLRPRVPDAWPGFKISYRTAGAGSRYEIEVGASGGTTTSVTSVTVDGRELAPQDGAARIPLKQDGKRHRVKVTLGA
ncbi:MAG TPA: cyclic beta 1-2 glucan synthetase [Candidatus Binatia bacterium]|nr:cyclic beta 1-2 glucan synthetase [Candidatus Binatia bacterium]